MTASVTALHVDTARLEILRVDESTRAHQADVTVTLQRGPESHLGDASGPPAAAHRPLLVAQATLRAVTEAGMRSFSAIEASVARSAGHEVALVAIDDPLLPNPLIGTSVIVDGAVQLGFARATLDAINRRIETDL